MKPILSLGGLILASLVWLGFPTWNALATEAAPRPSGRNLIINEASGKSQDWPVVYELPDDVDKAATVASLERLRDHLWPGRRLIDAAKSDEGTLQEGLKQGFTLYTVLGDESKLLNSATQPLGLRIEGDTLRWKGLSAPVRDLQIIAVGKNPYAEGYCVVYAAGTSKLLNNINANFHGPCSYHVFQGKTLLKEGYYGTDFSEAATTVSRAGAEADLRQFFSTLQRVHPDLLAKVTVRDYLELQKQTREEVLGKADPNGQVRIEDLAYALYYAAAFFHDGHTSVASYPFAAAGESRARFPGFLLSYDDGAFFVSAATKPEVRGMELLSVNGTPVREFLRPVLERCSGETEVFKAARFVGMQFFWYKFSRLCGPSDSLSLTLRSPQGKESEQQLATVSDPEFRKLAQSVGKPARSSQLGTRVEFLDGDRIAHFIYPSFTLSEQEKMKVDAIFAEIKARKSPDLIIDLRGNGGGNSAMGDHIFSYLYADKFRAFSKVRIKLSREVLSMPGATEQAPEGAADLEGMVAMAEGPETPGPKREACNSLAGSHGGLSLREPFADGDGLPGGFR